MAPGGRLSSSGLGMASAKPLRSPLWPRAQEQPSGPIGWVSWQRCSWRRCMHMGEGPPPYSLGRAWGGRRLGLGVVPAGSAPTGGHAAQPPEDAEGLFLPFPTSHREGSSQGLGVGATEGWAALGSLSPAQQQRILGKPGLGWAGPWGQAPACPSKGGLRGRQALLEERPVRAGSAPWSPAGQPLPVNACPGPHPHPVASRPPILAGLTPPNSNFPEERE